MSLLFFIKLTIAITLLGLSLRFFLELAWDVFYPPRRKEFDKEEHYVNVLCLCLMIPVILVLCPIIYVLMCKLVKFVIGVI